MMLVAGAAMACGLAACSDDDTTPSGNITPADQLYLPRNNATIMLETGNTTHFEWAVSKASKNGYITYELLFDNVDGDFSQPLYVLTSDNNGYEPSAKVASSTLNTVATLAGADLGETATVKWTVRAWCGLNSEIYGSEAGVRTVSLTRINSVDPMPSEIKISGGITEGQKELTLFAASVIHTAKGKYTDQREAGAYEIFTKLTAGELIITDDLNRNFRLAEKNRMELIKDNEATTAVTVEHDGIYWLYVNFSNMTYKFKEISKVELFISSPGNKAELTYEGNGVWGIMDYAWNVKEGGNTDSRHKFICTYADGSSEFWGHFEDDCRDSEKSEAEKNPLFYNIFRHTFSNQWDNTWKVNEKEREGYGKKVSFWVHMNNTDDDLFLLERSLGVPLAVNMQGSATENQEAIALNKALPVLVAKGSDDLNVGREASIFECFTQLSSGDFSITDDKGRYYKLDASNMTFAIAENPATNTVSKAGIYWVALDFNAMTYKMREIEKVELWNKPWFGNKLSETVEMSYEGKGEWSISDYEWYVTDGSNKDTRYYFICTYVDGFKERWAYYSDDCRNNNNPGGEPRFYNIYRFDHSKLGEWDDSWKTLNDSEGVGKKATFHIYMNNTYAADYKHTRSFK